MDPQVILKTIDNTYSLSKQYPNQMFAVTSTKHALVLHATTGEQFHILRSCFFDNELILLDMALNRAFESRTNLIYYTSNNNSNNLDVFDEQTEDAVTLELILKNIDDMHSLSKRYPDQLFNVALTPYAVVLYSAVGEKFDIMRSCLSNEEISLVDTELKKASEKNMDLIYRTSNLDEEEEEMEVQIFDSMMGDHGYHAYSNEEVARMRRRVRCRNLNFKRQNQSNLKIEYRKRKNTDDMMESCEKRQRFDM